MRTVAEIDAHLAALNRIARDPRRTINDRVTARRCYDEYLDERNEAKAAEQVPA